MVFDLVLAYTALTAGILASLTPCVAVLFPITFYRFINNEKIDFKSYALYVAGFLSLFVVTGFLFQQLFNSSVSNGFKLFLSVGLIILGILQFMGKINPLNLKPFKNTFLFGAIFALAVSMTPCTLPYFATLMGVGFSPSVLLNTFLFGVGLLLPSTIALFAGRSLLSTVIKKTKGLSYLEKPLAILLIVTGLYLGLNLAGLSSLDVIFSSILIGLTLVLIMYKSVITKPYFTPSKLLLMGGLLTLWVSFTYHCYGLTLHGSTLPMCGVSCEICDRCLLLFSTAAIFSILGTFIVEKNLFRRKK
jgi:cytochrome c biogenesis protein CcdA